MIRIFEFLAAQINEDVKGQRGIATVYGFGDPLRIPANNLPAIVISPVGTAPSVSDSANDKCIHTIDVSVVVDERTYFNQQQDEKTGLQEVMTVMAETDDTGRPLDSTILAVVRRKLFENSSLVENIIDNGEIKYGFTGSREFTTIEAHYTFTVQTKPYFR